MSTLTKVLIVLLSVFSFFLCATVVTYVSSADNFREKYNTADRNMRTAKESQASAVRASEEAKQAVEGVKADLGAKLADREAQLTKLAGELNDQKRLNSQLQERLVGMDDRVATANGTARQQATLHEAAQQKVQALEAEKINREKDLSETSQSLLEKVTIIAQLNDQVRQLTQENQELSNRLNQSLVQYGKTAAQPATTVAPGMPGVRPVQPTTVAAPLMARNIALNGQVTRIDPRNRLVQINIGTAAGVRQSMTFHVIRGDQFVADIQIVEVWPDQAVGQLDIVKQGMLPQMGDKVATNL